MSTIAITGSVEVVTQRRATNINLSQSIADVEAKGPLELTIAAGATVPVPFTFSGTVEEVLFFCIYSPDKVRLDLEGTLDGDITIGLKGYGMWTFCPGEGLKTVFVHNPSATEAVTIEYAYAAKGDVSDVPEYWND